MSLHLSRLREVYGCTFLRFVTCSPHHLAVIVEHEVPKLRVKRPENSSVHVQAILNFRRLAA